MKLISSKKYIVKMEIKKGYKKCSYSSILGVIGVTTLSAQQPVKPKTDVQERMNVLFIAVDDLKPTIGAYGDPHAITPNLDRIAREGFAFTYCYVQWAKSGPTRASLLTGMRPDKTKVWDLTTNFREINPNAVSLPQHLKANGYETIVRGKVFHISAVEPGQDAPSWTYPYERVTNYVGYVNKPATGKSPVSECVDVPDNTYQDGRLAEEGIRILQDFAKSGKPFFTAIGFNKPHLPFVAPKKYWDFYDRSKLSLAPFRQKAANSPDIAYHISGELMDYGGIPKFDNYSEDVRLHLPDDIQLELIHAYYACVSYMDAQVGKLLDELDRLGLADNTIVILWGDHGWHLGDHGIWCKSTNFEQATRAPLLLRVPGIKGGVKPETLCEFVDIFPTLCELTRTPIPSWLDGVSLVPVLTNPKISLREYALSQHSRPNRTMGYSIRTERYRYTEWIGGGYTAETPYEQAKIVGRELYDYLKDPLETRSLIDDKEYAQVQKMMKELFIKAMEREHVQYVAYSARADWQIKPRQSDLK